MRCTDILHIDAPPERLWDLTIDVGSWPALFPTVRAVERLDEGPLRPGSAARVSQPAQRPKVWTVDEVVEHRRFRWSTRSFGTAMTATHELEPAGAGTRN